jgi:hypothetical protein
VKCRGYRRSARTKKNCYTALFEFEFAALSNSKQSLSSGTGTGTTPFKIDLEKGKRQLERNA